MGNNCNLWLRKFIQKHPVIGFPLRILQHWGLILQIAGLIIIYYIYVFVLCLRLLQNPIQICGYLCVFHSLGFLTVWSLLATVLAAEPRVPEKYYVGDWMDSALRAATPCRNGVPILDCSSPSQRLHQIRLLADAALTQGLAFQEVDNEGRLRYCFMCKCLKPDRSRHCSTCGHCVLKYDHHCPYINKCINLRNYKQYVLYTGYSSLFSVWIIATMWFPLFRLLRDIRSLENVDAIFMLGLCVGAAATFGLYFLSQLFCYHVKLCVRNMTTCDQIKEPIFCGDPEATYDRGSRWANFADTFGWGLWLFPVNTRLLDGLHYTVRCSPWARRRLTLNPSKIPSEPRKEVEGQSAAAGWWSSSRARLCVALTLLLLIAALITFFVLFGVTNGGNLKTINGTAESHKRTSSEYSSAEGSGTSAESPTISPSRLPTISSREEVDEIETIGTTEPSSTEVATTMAFVPATEEERTVVEECSAVGAQKPSCPTQSQPPLTSYGKWYNADANTSTADLLDDIVPVHYSLNLTVPNADTRLLSASAEVFVRIAKPTAAIPLQLDRTVINLSAERVVVKNCQTGEFICATAALRLVDRHLLVVVLNTTLEPDSLISVYFEFFEVQIYSNPAVVIQAPSKWERHRAWILGSQMEGMGAHRVFPAIDLPNVKATFKFCAAHPRNMTARSNMPTQWQADAVPTYELRTTCFQKSPALLTTSYGFTFFDNLLPIHVDTRHTPVNVEVFVGKHLKASENRWIVEEVDATLAKMSDLTGVPYPIRKLTVLVSPLGSDGTHGLGLVRIKDYWIEYPKYALTHSILARQVVQQWISNVFTICDHCVQDGLSLYLEWFASADLDTVAQSAAAHAAETKRKLLRGTADRQPMRALLIEPSKVEDECAERMALVFATVEETFGIDAVHRFVRLVAEQKQWGACVTNDEVADALMEATLSPVAQQIFTTFIAAKSYPIVRLVVHEGQIRVSAVASDSADSRRSFTVPFGVINENGRETSLVSNGTNLSVEAPGVTVLVHPNATALFRATYDAENYARLADCALEKQCHRINRDTVATAVGDLCWALMADKLDASKADLPVWHQLFRRLQAGGLVQGECSCCMQSRNTASAQCKWTWRDKCARLALRMEN